MIDDIKIWHGYVTYWNDNDDIEHYDFLSRKLNINNEIEIPEKFHRLIKSISLHEDDLVPCTIGIDNNGIWAISIVHNKDSFDRKLGASIVIERIKKARGDAIRSKLNKKTKEIINFNTKYNKIPETVYIPEGVV